MGEQDFHNVRSLILKQQEQLLHQVWELHRVHQLQRHKALMSRHTKNLERQTKSQPKKAPATAPASTSSPDDGKQGSGDKEKQGSNDKQGSNGKQGSNEKQGSDDKSTEPQPAGHATAAMTPVPAPSTHPHRSASPRPMMWPNQPVPMYGQAPYYTGGFPQGGMGGWSAPPNQQQYMQMMSQYYANSAMPHPYSGYAPPSVQPDQVQPPGTKSQVPGPSSYPQAHPMAQYGGTSYDTYMNRYNAYSGGARPSNPASSTWNQQDGKAGGTPDRHHRINTGKEASGPAGEPSKQPVRHWWKDPREVFGSPVTGPPSNENKGNSNQSDDADIVQRGPAKLAMKRYEPGYSHLLSLS